MPPGSNRSEAFKKYSRRVAHRIGSGKTVGGYRPAREAYATFCKEVGIADPAPTLDIAENGKRMTVFIAWLFDKKAKGKETTLAPATVQNYASGVRHAWRVALGRAPLPRLCLSSVLMRAGTAQEARPPRIRDPLDARFFKALREVRCPLGIYCAIIFAYVFFLRAGEYCFSSAGEANDSYIMRNGAVEKLAKGAGIRVTLTFRKNNPSGRHLAQTCARSHTNPAACPVKAWTDYNEKRDSAHKAADGYAFTDHRGRPTTRRAIAVWIKKAARHLGLVADNYSTHSCRIGGATAAWRAKMSVTWIMQRGFWLTLAGILPYLRRHADDDAGVADVFLGYENPRTADKTNDEELLTLEQERSAAASRPLAGDSDSDSDDEYEPASDCEDSD